MRDLIFGVWSRPRRAIADTFVAFSVLWTLTEGLGYFVPCIQFKGVIPLGILIAISLGYALKAAWRPSRVEIRIAYTNTVLEVLFGDLFVQPGIRAFAVNEFFDSQLGAPVSEKSIHGTFLKRFFGGHPESFDKQIDAELKDNRFELVERAEGKTKRFALGSTALITVDQDKYIAFALAKTDPKTCKACSDVTLMWLALNHLWQRARIETGGNPLNLPLVGSGLSGIGLPTRDLLNLLILSAITETKAKTITTRIRFVLSRDRYDELDLREIKEHWET